MAGGAACAGAAATASATTDWPHKKVGALEVLLSPTQPSPIRTRIHTHTHTRVQVTLIKPLVGRVRTPSCPLPADPAHVYGARVQKDSETAATRTYTFCGWLCE